jgi:lysophospholipase L1-like esterase
LVNEYNIPLPKQLIFGGDSKMTTLGGQPSAPEQTILALNPAYFSYLNNTAVSGRTTQDVLNALDTEVLNYVKPITKNVFAIMIGHNDLHGTEPDQTPENAYANILNMATQVRLTGCKFIILTDIFSYHDNIDLTWQGITFMAAKQLLRSYIYSQPDFFDAIVDCQNIPQLTPDNMIPGGLYSSDGIHPNATADGLIAALVVPVVQAFFS